MVNKLAEGHPELVRPCVGCNQGCMDNIFKGRPLDCLSNSDAGLELETGTPSKKSTLVIGAGVAGLEYALRASQAGASVTVWERGQKPGGQMDIVSAPPGRESFAELPLFIRKHQRCWG